MPTPHDVYCSCGDQLEITKRTLDSDGDLTIHVSACGSCAASAAQAAVEQAAEAAGGEDENPVIT